MNLEKNLIFKAIVGSQSFGTNTPESDIDHCGVYMQPMDDILGYNYIEQTKVNKDEYYYEVKRFLSLLSEAKPNALELVYAPTDCIVYKDPVFDLIIEKRDMFITQQCFKSFGNYALAQIHKARGLDKKMNWEASKTEKKTPLDFAYVTEHGKTTPLTKWLQDKSLNQEFCGLVHLDHFKDTFAIYYDKWGAENMRPPLGFRGIVKEDSDEFRTSSIPKEFETIGTVYYNKDGYSMHCKSYKSYQQWLDERNEQRYRDNSGHGQKYDSKNMMHCRRLLDMAIEIAQEGKISVRRPDASYLLKIKKGEEDIAGLEDLFKKSDLPLTVDMDQVNELLIKVRKHKNK